MNVYMIDTNVKTYHSCMSYTSPAV